MKKYFTLLSILFLGFAASAQGLWQQKVNCPSNNKGSVSFSINAVGYMYTGEATNNFYTYDPAANTWTAKANFPGGARFDAAGFATDSFGYIGTGSVSASNRLSDFYQYNPVTDSWAAKANYPDTLSGVFAFCISNTGYFAGGDRGANGGSSPKCFAYNSATNSWSQKDSLPSAIYSGFSAVANGKAYCGLATANWGTSHLDSVYEYNPLADSWQTKAPHHLTTATYSSVYSFVLNNLIYVADPNNMTGYHGTVAVYNPAGNSWSSISGYPYPSGTPCDQFHSAICGMTIGSRGFMGNSNSCTGISFWEYDPASSFAISAFTPDTLCERDLISVTFSSSLTFNAGNHFKLRLNGANYFANSGTTDSIAGTTAGTYTFKVPQAMTSGSTSLDELAIYSTNPATQTSYLGTKVLVKRGPVTELPFASSYWHCDGSAVLLYRAGAGSESHIWSSNPAGISDTTAVLSITPTSTTTIYVTDVYNATGCSASDSTVVNFSLLPSLQITDSVFSICPNGSVTLGGTPLTNGSYLWTGGGLNTSVVNPSVSPVASTTYHVALTDTVTTCHATGNTQVNLAQAPLQPICFVTVDSASTHNVVVWEKVDRDATDSFYIYREISTNNYQKIGAVHGDSLSEFHDYAANPNVTAYRYKISAKDTCVNEGVLSAYHNTIHLQYLGTGNLIWNVYEIENDTTPVSSFDVMIDALANGTWTLLVNVPGNQYTATDINFSTHPNALYRIAANWSYTCTAARSGGTQVLSNIISITATGVANVEATSSISLYPNPATDKLFIQTNGAAIERVNIYNTTGSLVMAVLPSTVNCQLSTASLANGVYIAEIKTKDAMVKRRWVKM